MSSEQTGGAGGLVGGEKSVSPVESSGQHWAGTVWCSVVHTTLHYTTPNTTHHTPYLTGGWLGCLESGVISVGAAQVKISLQGERREGGGRRLPRIYLEMQNSVGLVLPPPWQHVVAAICLKYWCFPIFSSWQEDSSIRQTSQTN